MRRKLVDPIAYARGEKIEPSVEERQKAERKSEQERRSQDPEVQQRRKGKAAYKAVERDPYLGALKNLLPRKGEIKRNTEKSHGRMLDFISGVASIGSSDPTHHAALNWTPEQLQEARRLEQTAPAKEANERQGDDTKQRVKDNWHALSDIPEHNRATKIAQALGLSRKTVDRALRHLGLYSPRKRT